MLMVAVNFHILYFVFLLRLMLCAVLGRAILKLYSFHLVLSSGDSLRQLRLFGLEKRRLWGHLTVAFQYLKGLIRKIVTKSLVIRQEVMVLN